MAEYEATVATTLSPEEAFSYMADFSHTSQWDPNCERAIQTSPGEIGAGTTFRLAFSGVGGQGMELDYEMKEHEPPRRFVLEGGNDSVHSVDTVEVEPDGSGAKVTYTAQLTLKGIKQLANPILAMGLQKAGSDARKGLEKQLNPGT